MSRGVEPDYINVHFNKDAALQELDVDLNNKETCAFESRCACLCDLRLNYFTLETSGSFLFFPPIPTVPYIRI